ncbi:MAG: ABC transporter permease subunit [Nisaea sp.]|jgi:sn-glycerol 3-phosphate transport system permease protein|uniref:ABC transporter permease subunit n=1 Tax=Nisaea sp. TaxID=2024842 RepID=UPI001B287A68|nr:ABC transporter permease subunit [Nisaea sp.]MBO6560567.1 ABC transporter permease subunit [Nisaea sp.]
MKRQQFDHISLPYLLIAPQLAIIMIFFVWPAAQAIYQSFMLEDPFGLASQFVGFDNFREVVSSDHYATSAVFTLVFSALVAFLSMAIALLLAVKADGIIHGQSAYKIMLTWVYAVAPAVAGMIGTFLFDRSIGSLNHLLNATGWPFNPQLDVFDASFTVILVSVWKQVSVNFIYFLAGLQSIPRAVREAALIDCRNGFRRFWTVTLPLLAPTGFFVLVINITYAFFDTFGVIDTMTRGAPGGGTATLVYKVYQDGFLGADLGGSSAQSVILMILVLALTVVQFRVLEKRIHY